MMLQQILQQFPEEEFLLVSGFDDAVMGIEIPSMRLIYSVTRIIGKLSEEMTLNDACEHFDYNIAGGYIGDNTPIWCYDSF